MENLVIQSRKEEKVPLSCDSKSLQSRVTPRSASSEISWMIGGPQGSGVDSASTLFAKACAFGGYSVFGEREYHSNIKGEPSHFQVMVSKNQSHSITSGIHILVSFDKRTVDDHIDELIPQGTIIFDPSLVKVEREDILKCPISYSDLLSKLQNELGTSHQLNSLAIMKNVMAVGASFGVLGYNMNLVLDAISTVFRGRKADVVEANKVALKIGYEAGVSEISARPHFQLPRLIPPNFKRKKIYLAGTTAVAMGKILAGCKFQAYYPITPATDESEFLESHPEYGVVVEQTEDEIAAITMAIGAALTGVRSSVSTSGPGFALMTEAIGWAGINEVPVVIVDYQRGGPSTGLPTRTEQGDLRAALFASPGDLPKIVLAPGDVEECFYGIIDAFNYAERYQTPVIMLADKNVASCGKTVEAFKVERAIVDRGKVLDESRLNSLSKKYKRFDFDTEGTGISPRAFIGARNGVYWNAGEEHDELGHLSEDPENRIRMMNKRMDKLITADREIPLEERAILHGDLNSDVTIIGWGSTKGQILDALEMLKAIDISARFLQVKMINPLPIDYVKGILEESRLRILVEQNYASQLGDQIRAQTGIECNHHINKYNGRAISRSEIYEAIKDIMMNRCQNIVLRGGI